MSFIPEHIYHKIMLFNSHPVADMFNIEFEYLIEKSKRYDPNDYSFDQILYLDRQMRIHEENEEPEDDPEFYGDGEDDE